MHRTLALGVLALAVLGCVSDSSDAPESRSSEHPSSTSTSALEAHDVVFEAPEVTIPSGAEAMNCHFLPPLEHDLVIRGFRTQQSQGGHHMVVYRALTQKPAGTTEDCSSGESMSNLMLVLTQTGTQEPGASAIEFPENNVVVLPAGIQLVAQSHYINSSDAPVVTHDVMTLFATDADPESLTRLHLFVAGATSFEIPPDSNYSTSVGCVLDNDLTMLALTPHMHEWGTKIQLQVGVEGAMNVVADELNWAPDMRDLPPITSFSVPSARSDGHFQSGQAVALTCTWRNTEHAPLKFPQEMCAMVGYFTTEAKDADDIMCLTPLR